MNATNEILLRRKHLVIAEPINAEYEQDKNEKALVVTGLKNVQALGFTFSQALLENLFHFSKNEFKKFYTELVPKLKKLVGADVKYKPMYPNFPEQVAEADEVELFINAIIHYWSFGNLMPEYEVNERMPLIDDNKMAILSVGSHEDLWKSSRIWWQANFSVHSGHQVCSTVIKECEIMAIICRTKFL